MLPISKIPLIGMAAKPRAPGYIPQEPACQSCRDLGFVVTADNSAASCSCVTHQCIPPQLRTFGTIPKPMADAMTFRSFYTDHIPVSQRPQTDSAKSFIQQWSHQPAGWLILTGPSGSGKTHLAISAANQQQNPDVTVFISAIEFISMLREASSPNHQPNIEAISREIMNASLLIIDDYGAERNTDFATEHFTRVLNHRYDHRLPTIITTNVEPDQLQRLRPHLHSRMQDRALITQILLNAPDFRQQS